MNYLFSGKIYCGKCGWKMRGRKERNRKAYICAKYNKNRTCDRNKIYEDAILIKVDDINSVEKIIVNDGNIEIKIY